MLSPVRHQPAIQNAASAAVTKPAALRNSNQTFASSTLSPEKKIPLCTTLIRKIQKFFANIFQWFKSCLSQNKNSKPQGSSKNNVGETSKTPESTQTSNENKKPGILKDQIPAPAGHRKNKSVTFASRPDLAPLDVTSDDIDSQTRNIHKLSFTPTAAKDLTRIAQSLQVFLSPKLSTPRSQGNLKEELKQFESELNQVEQDLHDHLKTFKDPYDKHLAMLRIKDTLMQSASLFFKKASSEFSLENLDSIKNYKHAVGLQLRAIGLCLSLQKVVQKKLLKKDIEKLQQSICPNFQEISMLILEDRLVYVKKDLQEKINGSPNHPLSITYVLIEKRLEELEGYRKGTFKLIDISARNDAHGGSEFNPAHFHLLIGADTQVDENNKFKDWIIEEGTLLPDGNIRIQTTSGPREVTPLWNMQRALFV